MAFADLHVHSKYSNHPSEWFLQRLGTSESYTDPDYIYSESKKRGMDFVTITDHNSIEGALYLVNTYPDDTFMGVESTAYFPEDGCKVHILIFDFTVKQFEQIQRLRRDIYKLRDFLKEQGLPHSVAHATYTVNNTITWQHLEKLILLFDVFESINGGRDKRNNSEWFEFLGSLTEKEISEMEKNHGIKPFSETPWQKGFTGGSDDHAGLFFGYTYTVSQGSAAASFLGELRGRETFAVGRNTNFYSFVFSIYKIVWDFIKRKTKKGPSFLSGLNDILFENRKKGFWTKIKDNVLKRISRKKKNKTLKTHILEFSNQVKEIQSNNISERLDSIYDAVAALSDDLIKSSLKSIKKHIKKSNLDGLVKNVSSLLPVVFMNIPFLATFNHMNNGREILAELKQKHGRSKYPSGKRILWFTDTLTDLNGVAVTLRNIAWYANKHNHALTLAAAGTDENDGIELPPNVIDLPVITKFKLPFYENLKLRIPSVLKSLKKIYAFDPDEVFISSPGPIGLIGMLLGKLLGIPVVNIYHTDFSSQLQHLSGDVTLSHSLEQYLSWFYNSSTRILVPTREYRDILSDRQYRMDKIDIFKRGIDTSLFLPSTRTRNAKQPSVTFLYAGRVSDDKNVGLLLKVFSKFNEEHEQTRLIIAGDGPGLETFKKDYKNNPAIIFKGLVKHEDLTSIYQQADFFVFPSTTDTFGRVVLESQACGTPVIVSPVGGPRELVRDGVTGFIVPSMEESGWSRALDKARGLIQYRDEEYLDMRHHCRRFVENHYSLDAMWEGLFETTETGPAAGIDPTIKKPETV